MQNLKDILFIISVALLLYAAWWSFQAIVVILVCTAIYIALPYIRPYLKGGLNGNSSNCNVNHIPLLERRGTREIRFI